MGKNTIPVEVYEMQPCKSPEQLAKETEALELELQKTVKTKPEKSKGKK